MVVSKSRYVGHSATSEMFQILAPGIAGLRLHFYAQHGARLLSPSRLCFRCMGMHRARFAGLK
jgi:hypothetical protein